MTARSAWRAVAWCSLGGAVLFGLPATLVCWPDLLRGLAGTMLGAALGALAAPMFAPSRFRHPALFQVGLAAVLGAALALLFGGPLSAVLMAATVGGVVGWLAPVWLSWV